MLRGLRVQRRWAALVGAVGLLIGAAGCGGSDHPQPAAQNPAQPPPAQLPAPLAVQPGPSETLPPSVTKEEMAFLHQSFAQASSRQPPPNSLPPDTTITGKSTGKIRTEVEKLWPEIRFITPDGKRLKYTAVIDTELGNVEIDLLSDIAPNHVRSFVALARAGYFDGLFFETVIGRPHSKEPPRAVAGAAPEGDGNELGSVGYWLVPEILLPEKAAERGLRHQPGSVGTAASPCRLYICLTEAPMWDGEYTIFGKVTRGMDVVEKMFDQLAQDDRTQPPMPPPMIRKVTISTQPLDK
jgi:peptidyl-prolyl cis-trans isomerase B (cyclophilin B)